MEYSTLTFFTVFVLFSGCLGGGTTTSTTLRAQPPMTETTTTSVSPGQATATTSRDPVTLDTVQETVTTLPSGTFIANTADVPPGSSVDFTYGGEPAILVNIGGTYKAYVNLCTHRQCENSFAGGVLECPCHGSAFDPLTGEATKGPANAPLTVIELNVAGGGVYAL